MKITTSFLVSFFCLQSSIAVAKLSHGGLSGGGGNVIAAVPPTALQDVGKIASRIETARSSLRSLLEQKQVELEDGQLSPEIARLYSRLLLESKPTILDQLATIPFDLEDDKSCTDLYEVSVDGSIIDDGAVGTVCISAFNFAFKVRSQDIFAQASALLVHEYAELTGLTEEDAVVLQQSILNELLNTGSNAADPI